MQYYEYSILWPMGAIDAESWLVKSSVISRVKLPHSWDECNEWRHTIGNGDHCVETPRADTVFAIIYYVTETALDTLQMAQCWFKMR